MVKKPTNYELTKTRIYWLNQEMEKIGSEIRFGAEYPWSMYFLALQDKNKPNCYTHTFMQVSGLNNIRKTVDVIRELLVFMKQEGVFKKND